MLNVKYLPNTRSRRPAPAWANKHYNRFRHFDKDKVMMDFAIFAIAFNMGKMHLKGRIIAPNANKSNNPDKSYVIILVKTNFIRESARFSTLEPYDSKIAA